MWPPARACWSGGLIGEKQTVALDALAAELPRPLADYQQMLFQRAVDFRAANTHLADTLRRVQGDPRQGRRLPAWRHWCGDGACEKQINAETGATIRVIPFDADQEDGTCLIDGKTSTQRVLFARSY